MTDEMSEEELSLKRLLGKGFWVYAEKSIAANTRDYGDSNVELLMLEDMGEQKWELIQILPEWRENFARKGMFSNPPIEIKKYTYYFKRWIEYKS